MRLASTLLGRATATRHGWWPAVRTWKLAAHRRDDGSVSVLVAVMLVVLLGFVALAVDGGFVLVGRRVVQNAADSAADGGTWALQRAWNGSGGASGSTGATAASIQAVARDYATRNGLLPAGAVTVRYISNDGRTLTGTPDGRTRGALVDTTQPLPLAFARLYGFTTFTAGARAAALFGVVTGARGVVPWGVNDDAFRTYGTLVRLQPAQAGGNYGEFNFASIVPPECLMGDLTCYTDALRNGTLQPIRLDGSPGAPPGGYMANTFDMAALSMTSARALQERIDSAPGETCSQFAAGSRRVIRLPIINGSVGDPTVRFVRFRALFLVALYPPRGVEGCFVRDTLSGVDIDPSASPAADGGVTAMRSVPWP